VSVGASGAHAPQRGVVAGPLADRRTLYTIGHSTRPAGELIDILRASAVTRVVDIRRIPRSRTHPQFGIDVLPETLAGAGLDYVHLAALGGLRGKCKGAVAGANAGWARRSFRNYADYAQTPLFAEGLRDLLEMAARQTCAIMCAETVWWRCHRRIVTDHVLAHHVAVVHLFTRTKQTPASLTPFAIVDARGGVSYPALSPPVPSAEHALAHDRSTGAPIQRSFALGFGQEQVKDRALRHDSCNLESRGGPVKRKEENREGEDLNRNGIDDTIEPPIRDVSAGTRQLADRLLNNQGMDPTLSGGDIDARWEDAESGGDETVAGSTATPGQNDVDEIGEAMGVTYAHDEDLKAGDKAGSRDKHRWELDPASSEGYVDRTRDEK
jgi:hypothetical protein